MSQPDYADLCEWYASMGFSGSDAAHYAGCGVRPEAEEDEEPETEEGE
jgi:hypothetical protein